MSAFFRRPRERNSLAGFGRFVVRRVAPGAASRGSPRSLRFRLDGRLRREWLFCRNLSGRDFPSRRFTRRRTFSGRLRSRSGCLRRRRRGQHHPLQFAGIGQFVRGLQPEVLQEIFRGGVKQRPARHVRAPGDFHQAAVEQNLHNAVHCHATNGLNIRPGHRLAIGHDGQGLELRAGETRRFRFRIKLPHPRRTGGIADQRPAIDPFHELEGPSAGRQLRLQFGQNREHVVLLGLGKIHGLLVLRPLPRRAQSRDDLLCQERFGRSEHQGFNDLYQGHFDSPISVMRDAIRFPQRPPPARP